MKIRVKHGNLLTIGECIELADAGVILQRKRREPELIPWDQVDDAWLEEVPA